MDAAARLQLMSLVNRIPLKERGAIAEMLQEHVIFLHHGLGTWIRNMIRSGEMNALFRWSCEQVPEARSLDDRARPIILEVWKTVSPSSSEGGLRSPPGDS